MAFPKYIFWREPLNPKVILYAATGLALVQYLAHAFLFLSAKPTHGPEEPVVLEAMKSNRFKIGLSPRSYWDLYFGYGLLVILGGMVEVVILWQLAAVVNSYPALIKPFVSMFFIFNIVHALLVWKYFALLAPVIFDLIIAACMVMVFISL